MLQNLYVCYIFSNFEWYPLGKVSKENDLGVQIDRVLIFYITNTIIYTFSHSLSWLYFFFFTTVFATLVNVAAPFFQKCFSPAHLPGSGEWTAHPTLLTASWGGANFPSSNEEEGEVRLQILVPTPRDCILKLPSWKDCPEEKCLSLSLSCWK